MSLSTLLLKGTFAVARQLARVTQRNYNSALPLSAAISSSVSSSFAQFHYSTTPAGTKQTSPSDAKISSTQSLVWVIESEIKFAQESDDYDRVEGIPKDFPFKIDDNAGNQTIILTREYEGELIKLEVQMPDLVTGDDNEVTDDDDDDDDDDEKPTQSTVPMVVTVTKKSGITLEFDCVAYPHQIAIDNLTIRIPDAPEDHVPYEGPSFHDLDVKLRDAFHKYLEMREIKPRTTNFLHEYMINKDSREYLRWLNNLKSFIEA